MPKFEVFWDEVVTYCVLVEADDEDLAEIRWNDPAYWDSAIDMELRMMNAYTNPEEDN